jgi:hypothetical protein
MRLRKPMPKSSVSVVAIDKATNKSKSITVHETTPEEIVEIVRAAADDADQPDVEPIATA